MTHPEDLTDAVQALLRDVRTSVKSGNGSGAAAAAASQRQSSPGAADRAVDVRGMNEEIRRLENELIETQQALEAERERHAHTKELLRLALRPDADVPDVTGSPARRGRSASRGSAQPYRADATPQFVKQASAVQQHYSPRGAQTASATVVELFNKASTPRRQRPASRSPSGASSRAHTPTSAATGSRRGGAASSHRAAQPPFGSQSERFKPMMLSGHHGMFASRNATNRYDELSRDEARAIALDMQRRHHRTPPRSTGAGSVRGQSPVFTGVVRAAPSSGSSRLRSPDIANWVRSLGSHDRGDADRA